MNFSRRTSVLAALVLATALPGVLAPSVRAAGPQRTDRYVVVLADTASADPSALAARHLRSLGRAPVAPEVVFRHALRGYAAALTPDQAAALGRSPEVRFVSREHTYRSATRTADGPVRPGTSPARPGTSPCRTAVDVTRRQCLPEWADRIDAERSSARSGDGRGAVTGVNVAVVDSGISGGHPDLDVRGGTDCVTGQPVVPGASLSDPAGFGTAVAGAVGARDNRTGVVGVAPGVPLWSYKVFPDDGGTATDSSLLCALDRVAATRADGDPGNDIHVATLAFARTDLAPADDGRCGTVNGDALHLAVCTTTRAGVTFVAAAGSFRWDVDLSVPAAYDEVLTATAVADFDGRPGGRGAADCRGTDYGSFGFLDDQVALPLAGFARSAADRRHLVAAPGVCVAFTGPADVPLPTLVTGTGAAAAVAAGVTALCVAHGPCAEDDPARTVRRIVSDADRHRRDDPRFGYYGDPDRPVRGRFHGPLLSAALY
ncbi:S8 family serine peptidase [Streptomyces sp. NPDC053493]|uniref:S8 family serine peptidase n=1 Tax=Streptomyces sp. NPDC053493 TaxID=3365705 RepID=UPI0037D549AD